MPNVTEIPSQLQNSGFESTQVVWTINFTVSCIRVVAFWLQLSTKDLILLTICCPHQLKTINMLIINMHRLPNYDNYLHKFKVLDEALHVEPVAVEGMWLGRGI